MIASQDTRGKVRENKSGRSREREKLQRMRERREGGTERGKEKERQRKNIRAVREKIHRE